MVLWEDPLSADLGQLLNIVHFKQGVVFFNQFVGAERFESEVAKQRTIISGLILLYERSGISFDL